MARVTVVSGFHNRGPLLERTIESILGQSFSDLELIVFDDKSVDDTAVRLEVLAAQYADSRFRYRVHPENIGFVRGLRRAIQETDSEYIAIQGSGDASLPDRLREQVDYLDAHPRVAAVGGWYYNVQEAQGTRILRRPEAEGLQLEDLVQRNVFSHGEVMIRRTAYERVGGYRTIFKYAQDRDLWLRLARAGYAFGTIRKPIYERFVQFDGVSYVPAKIAEQACFSIAAQRLVQLDAVAELKAVRAIDDEGIEAFVAKHDPVVQGKLLRAAIRMIVFGDPEGGTRIARDSLTTRRRRLPVLALSVLYRSPLRGLARFAVGRITGLRAEVS